MSDRSQADDPAPEVNDLKVIAARLVGARAVPRPELMARVRELTEAPVRPDPHALTKLAAFAIAGIGLLVIAAAVTFL